MNFYEENLELFKEKIPDLYNVTINERPIFNIRIEKYIDDTLNYTILNDNKKCFIHSIFDINEEMNQMFKRVDKSVNTLIIFGIGCGYAFDYIKTNFNNVKNILIN